MAQEIPFIGKNFQENLKKSLFDFYKNVVRDTSGAHYNDAISSFASKINGMISLMPDHFQSKLNKAALDDLQHEAGLGREVENPELAQLFSKMSTIASFYNGENFPEIMGTTLQIVDFLRISADRDTIIYNLKWSLFPDDNDDLCDLTETFDTQLSLSGETDQDGATTFSDAAS